MAPIALQGFLYHTLQVLFHLNLDGSILVSEIFALLDQTETESCGKSGPKLGLSDQCLSRLVLEKVPSEGS